MRLLRMQDYVVELKKRFKLALKSRDERAIWSTGELLAVMNRDVKNYRKLNTHQLGQFISKMQRSHLSFKRMSSGGVFYIFIENKQKRNYS